MSTDMLCINYHDTQLVKSVFGCTILSIHFKGISFVTVIRFPCRGNESGRGQRSILGSLSAVPIKRAMGK